MPISACENGVEHAHPRRALRLSELLRRALGATAAPPAGADPLINDICLDSRRARPGSAFVAIRGARDDGLRFAPHAAARGAVALITDHDGALPDLPVGVARVAHAGAAASKLAATLLGLSDAQQAGYRVCGVTGTNGKSTIAFMLRAILNAARRPAAMIGTVEYDLVGEKRAAPLTTPDAVSLVECLMRAHAAGARDAAIEVSSHSLHQGRVAGLRFEVGIFSNLTRDHLDYHGTLGAYRDAKRLLFESLDAGATAILNADDPAADAMAQACRGRVLTYGFSAQATARVARVDASIAGARFRLRIDNEEIPFETPLVGDHNIANAAAAILAAVALGVTFADAQEGIRALAHVPGRLQRVEAAALGASIFVDYAHTDDALRRVLAALRPLTAGRLFCVFGCGGDRDRTKRPRMARAVAEGADRFVITSDNPRTEDPLAIIEGICEGLGPHERARAHIEPDRAAAIRHAVGQLGRGDTLIIAGKGHEDYQIVGEARLHFDDVEQAALAVRGAFLHARADAARNH